MDDNEKIKNLYEEKKEWKIKKDRYNTVINNQVTPPLPG